MKQLSQQDIRKFLMSLSTEDGALYLSYEAEVAAQYMGCSDTAFSGLFLTKLWNVLRPLTKKYGDGPLRIMTTCGMGAKSLTGAPKNSQVYSMNHDSLCQVASKAIVQNMMLEYPHSVNFGSIADYYFVPGKFTTHELFHLVINTVEQENDYYRKIDKDTYYTNLPYYMYCIARSADFVMPGGMILAIIPAKENIMLEGFKMSDYSKYNFEKTKLIQDVGYSVYSFKRI